MQTPVPKQLADAVARAERSSARGLLDRLADVLPELVLMAALGSAGLPHPIFLPRTRGVLDMLRRASALGQIVREDVRVPGAPRRLRMLELRNPMVNAVRKRDDVRGMLRRELPWLRPTPSVRMDARPSFAGEYLPARNEIRLADWLKPRERAATLRHELQHAALEQVKRAGDWPFSTGTTTKLAPFEGSEVYLRQRKLADRVLQRLDETGDLDMLDWLESAGVKPDDIAAYKTLLESKPWDDALRTIAEDVKRRIAFSVYRHNIGEVLARETERRPAAIQRHTPPFQELDYTLRMMWW